MLELSGAQHGVELICRTFKVLASAYYHRKIGARSAPSVGDERLAGVIERIHLQNYDARRRASHQRDRDGTARDYS